MNTLPFVYGKGHLPFCTGVVPYNRINSTTTDPIGEGTLYPLTLSPEVFASIFWRVKSWRFSGSLSFGGAFEINGSVSFDRTFQREASETELACASNNILWSPFTPSSDSAPIEFTGTQDEDSVDLELDVRLRTRPFGFGSNFRAAMLDVTGDFRCYFAAQLFVSSPSQTAIILSTEELEDTITANTVTLQLPGIEPIELPMFEPNTSAELADGLIEPAEYYEWGGTYDSETGNLL